METISLVFSLAGVILIIIFTFVGARWFTGKMSNLTGTNMRLIERLPLGQTQSVAIVKVGKSYLLIGITPQTVTKLSELSEEDIQLRDTAATVQVPFSEQLKSVLNSKKNGVQKGNEEND